MDREVVEQKLDALCLCIRRIEDKCPPDLLTLERDLDLQDIISANLTRAVQLCVDIGAHIVAELGIPPPNTMGQTFDVLARSGFIDEELAMRLRKAVGFRNLAVHRYGEIDWAIVHSVAQHDIADFTAFVEMIASKLDR